MAEATNLPLPRLYGRCLCNVCGVDFAAYEPHVHCVGEVFCGYVHSDGRQCEVALPLDEIENHRREVHGCVRLGKRTFATQEEAEWFDKEQKVACSFCGRSIARSRLVEHMSRAHGLVAEKPQRGVEKAKDWDCSLCGKSFKSTGRYAIHMVQCSQRFLRISNFNSSIVSEPATTLFVEPLDEDITGHCEEEPG